jgi:hypothetical protein
VGTHSVAERNSHSIRLLSMWSADALSAPEVSMVGELRAQSTQAAPASTQTADKLNVNVGQDAGNVNVAGLGKAERARCVLFRPPPR